MASEVTEPVVDEVVDNGQEAGGDDEVSEWRIAL